MLSSQCSPYSTLHKPTQAFPLLPCPALARPTSPTLHLQHSYSYTTPLLLSHYTTSSTALQHFFYCFLNGTYLLSIIVISFAKRTWHDPPTGWIAVMMIFLGVIVVEVGSE